MELSIRLGIGSKRMRECTVAKIGAKRSKTRLVVLACRRANGANVYGVHYNDNGLRQEDKSQSSDMRSPNVQIDSKHKHIDNNFYQGTINVRASLAVNVSSTVDGSRPSLRQTASSMLTANNKYCGVNAIGRKKTQALR